MASYRKPRRSSQKSASRKKSSQHWANCLTQSGVCKHSTEAIKAGSFVQEALESRSHEPDFSEQVQRLEEAFESCIRATQPMPKIGVMNKLQKPYTSRVVSEYHAAYRELLGHLERLHPYFASQVYVGDFIPPDTSPVTMQTSLHLFAGDAADIVDGSSVATGDSHSAQWPSVYAMNLCPDPPAYFGETTNDTANTNNANSMLPEYLDTYYVDQAYSNPPALFDVNPHSSRTSYFADENTAYMESTLAMTQYTSNAFFSAKNNQVCVNGPLSATGQHILAHDIGDTTDKMLPSSWHSGSHVLETAHGHTPNRTHPVHEIDGMWYRHIDSGRMYEPATDGRIAFICVIDASGKLSICAPQISVFAQPTSL